MSAHHQEQPSRAPWGIIAFTAVLGVVWFALALYVARDPHRRRRVLKTAGRTWLHVENVTSRSTRPLRVRQRRLEAQAREIARELWDAVDDLPHVVQRFPIPPVRRRLYAHGAFMGAAPVLLGDPRWRRILAFLMPDVFRDVRRAVSRGVAIGSLIPMFENNPVMAAFGVWRSAGAPPHPGDDHAGLDGMEWDLFLSGEQVDAWKLAPEGERGALLTHLVDTMVIAHASSTDTVQEQIGLCQWNDVRKTRKTELGGVQAGAWLDLFGRALRLARAPDLTTAIRAMQDEPRHDADEECLRHTFVDELPPELVVAEYRALTGRAHLSVVIEIKSLQVSAALLAALVGELNRRGIHVAAVGSFTATEIRGLSGIEQQVRGEPLPGPREILFLHYAGDVQAACDKGLLPPGTSAMFNGASLLLAVKKARRFVYRVDEDVVDELDEYRQRHELHLGLYVQENDCDAEAAALLSELVARRAETFSLGFAWGGVFDEVAFEAGQGDHRGFGSQRVLGRFGVAAAWKRRKVS